jgi:hypothetical protein
VVAALDLAVLVDRPTVARWLHRGVRSLPGEEAHMTVKKRIALSLDLEDPTAERVRALVATLMGALKGKVRRGDTPVVSIEDVVE